MANQAAKNKRYGTSTSDILVEDLRRTGLMAAGWVWLVGKRDCGH